MKIPKIIHQTWKDNNIPKTFKSEWIESWKNIHPNWEYKLWTDDDNLKFLEKNYPWFLDVYNTYNINIKRADAIRYFILHHYGGLYVDLDFECVKNLEPLLENSTCFISQEPHHNNDKTYLSNALMASTEAHPFFSLIIEQMLHEFKFEKFKNATSVTHTGPELLDRVMTKYNFNDIKISPNKETFLWGVNGYVTENTFGIHYSTAVYINEDMEQNRINTHYSKFIEEEREKQKFSKVNIFGSSGIYFLENVFLYKNTFYLVDCDFDETKIMTNTIEGIEPDEWIIDPDNIKYEEETDEEKFLKINKKDLPFDKYNTIHETAFVFLENRRNFLVHYFHFMEHLLGMWTAYKSLDNSRVSHIIFPNHNDAWKGRINNLNHYIIKGLFPDSNYWNRVDMRNKTWETPILFKKIILGNRETCDGGAVNKMLFGQFASICNNIKYVNDLSNKIHEYYKTVFNPRTKKNIVYIKRDGGRSLNEKTEKMLLYRLENLKEYTLEVVSYETLSFKEQMQVNRNADVLIGVHGNGLSHELFLPEGAAVFELFPKKSRAFDYCFGALFRNHRYYAFIENEGLMHINDPYSQKCYGNVNQEIFNLDINNIIRILKEEL